MTAPDPIGVAEDARLWVLCLQDPGFSDWDGFTAWLEQAPGNFAAYETAMEADEAMAQLFAASPVAYEPAAPEPARTRFRFGRTGWAAGGAAVAAAVAGIVFLNVAEPASETREIATRAGERRVVELADGSRIRMNGATRIALDSADPRRATLVEGEALFEVRHDARHPFLVTAGNVPLQDAGTVFNVVQDAGRTSVAVAEGAVLYRPGPDQLRLDPGQALEVEAEGAPVLSRVEAHQVGSWRSDQLVYWNVGLGRIAKDLSRNLGVQVSVARGSQRVRFSGILVIGGKPETVMERIAPLLGVPVAKAGSGWVMGRADETPR